MSARELLTRGVAKLIPDALAKEKIASGKKLRIYWGIDPTGSRLHLGHAVPLRKMQQFADAGHQVIMLIGSFTAMIGDPTDKEGMRTVLTKEQVEENFKTYKEQASKILDFSKIEIRYNNEWLDTLTLRDAIGLASHFTVQQMLERDMFEKRISEGKPIGYHEFFYPLMVGYDSVVLDVDCEIGGTDQEFNMLAGRTLQKAFGKRDKFVLTMKLLEGTDGRKMSKTYDNCVYVDDEPKDMYGKLMRVEDRLITAYMECCTDIPMEDIAAAEKAMKKGENPKQCKMHLAKEIVALYHDTNAATKAEEEFTRLFSEKGLPDDVPQAKAKNGDSLIDLLIREGLIPSKSEARRLIEQKGITLNDISVTALDAPAEEGIARVGKRKFLNIEIH